MVRSLRSRVEGLIGTRLLRCSSVATGIRPIDRSRPLAMAECTPVSTAPAQQLGATIAEILVRSGAVSFRTSPFFRFTSGVESPVYVDNRQLLGNVEARLEVVEALVETARPLAVAALAGTATAGIPWGAWMADRLSLPFLYVRSEAKAWGKQRAVEGAAPEGARVLVIEDLAYTAGSLVSAAENLRDAGFVVGDALTIASYDMPSAQARLQSLGLRHITLTTIDQALAAAQRAESLGDHEVSIVERWLLDRRSERD